MKGLNFTKREEVYEIETEGNVHSVSFARESGKYVLYVDGAPAERFPLPSFVLLLFGDLNDYDFTLDGVPVVIAMRFGRQKIAVNGIYTDTGAEFKPVLPLPVWGYIFIAATVLPPLFLSQSFWDLMLGGCCAYMCTHFILKNPDINADTTRRIVFCVLVTLGSWLVLGFFARLGAVGTFF